MKIIPLSRGKRAVVNNIDFKWASRWKWRALKCGKNFYAARTATRKSKRVFVLMHREIFIRATGIDPKTVDHKDRDTLNNIRTNLRAASQSQQMANTGPRKDNTSGHRGVYWNPLNHNWRALIHWERQRIEIGSFQTLELAVKARTKYAKQLFGEFNNINKN